MDYQISEKELAPLLALTHRVTVTMPTIAQGIGAGFGALMEEGGRTGAQWAGPPFILYPQDCSGEFEMIACMPVAPGATGGEGVTLEEIPGARVATTVHTGSYREICNAYTALQKWMTDNGRRPVGMVREVYLNDPGEVAASDLLTEVVWPIA